MTDAEWWDEYHTLTSRGWNKWDIIRALNTTEQAFNRRLQRHKNKTETTPM